MKSILVCVTFALFLECFLAQHLGGRGGGYHGGFYPGGIYPGGGYPGYPGYPGGGGFFGCRCRRYCGYGERYSGRCRGFYHFRRRHVRCCPIGVPYGGRF